MVEVALQRSGDEWHILATAELEEEVSRMAYDRWQEHLCIRKTGSSRYEVAFCKMKGERLVSTGALRLLITDGWFETLELLGEAPDRIQAFIRSTRGAATSKPV
jgi:hypothetical protein